MDQATRDALVTGYQALIPSLKLPDPNDRHVVAAAVTQMRKTYRVRPFTLRD